MSKIRIKDFEKKIYVPDGGSGEFYLEEDLYDNYSNGEEVVVYELVGIGVISNAIKETSIEERKKISKEKAKNKTVALKEKR